MDMDMVADIDIMAAMDMVADTIVNMIRIFFLFQIEL
jgi:hypothetical protein